MIIIIIYLLDIYKRYNIFLPNNRFIGQLRFIRISTFVITYCNCN